MAPIYNVNVRYDNVAAPRPCSTNTTTTDRQTSYNRSVTECNSADDVVMSSLNQLVAMGFPEELAKACLEAHDGDLQQACNTLLGMVDTASAIGPRGTAQGQPGTCQVRCFLHN